MTYVILSRNLGQMPKTTLRRVRLVVILLPACPPGKTRTAEIILKTMIAAITSQEIELQIRSDEPCNPCIHPGIKCSIGKASIILNEYPKGVRERIR